MVHGATVLRAGVDVLVTPFDTCMPCDSMRAGDLGFFVLGPFALECVRESFI